MIIWAFPGIGKSNIYLSSVIDCDVAYFKFNIPEDTVLHNNELMHDCSLNSDYPDNYIKYVASLKSIYLILKCLYSRFNFFFFRCAYYLSGCFVKR